MNLTIPPEKCKRCGRYMDNYLDFCEYCGAPKYERPPEKKYLNYITDVSSESLINAVEDEYGVAYSKDGKRLVKCRNTKLIEYTVKDGTKVICDRAFGRGQNWVYSNLLTLTEKNTLSDCVHLKSIIIPNSVTTIGFGAFPYCGSLEKVYIRCSADADEAAVIEKFKKLLWEELHDKIEIVRR